MEKSNCLLSSSQEPSKCLLLSNLKHSELARGVFEDAVHTVGNMEPVTPIMISNLAIVLLHSNDESHLGHRILVKLVDLFTCKLSYQSIVVEFFQPKQIDKHKESLLYFGQIISSNSVIIKPV